MPRGSLRGIAVTKATRMPQLHDLAAIAETPPGYELTSWYGLVAPRAHAAKVREEVGRWDALSRSSGIRVD